MKLVGTARNAELYEPSTIIEWFYQTTQVNFLVITDEEVKLPSGSTKSVPVRMDLFERTPNLEGTRVMIKGKYDAYLEVVRANTLEAPEWRFRIGAPRRMNPLLAAILLVVTALAQLIMLGFFFGLFVCGLGFVSNDVCVPGAAPLIVGTAGLILSVVALGCAGLFYRYTAITSLAEWFSRVMQRIVTYPKNNESDDMESLRLKVSLPSNPGNNE